MGRSPELEAIFEAWFELDNCSPTDQAARNQHLNELLEQALTNAGMKSVSRRELMAALRAQYRDFAKGKYIAQRQKLSRLK
jgi:hypothetical protein